MANSYLLHDFNTGYTKLNYKLIGHLQNTYSNRESYQKCLLTIYNPNCVCIRELNFLRVDVTLIKTLNTINIRLRQVCLQ